MVVLNIGVVTMGFTEAVQTVLAQKYATFSGRASRSEFWWFQLFYFLVLSALGITVMLVVAATDGGDEISSLTIAIAVIAGLFMLATFLPQLSLQVRRFHDRNISGWWYFGMIILGAIPYLSLFTGLAITVISVLRGTEGPNQFGPNPLHRQVRSFA